MQREKSNSLHTEALEHLVGGVNSPVRAFKSVHGNPIYFETASYGHMGREPKFVKKSFTSSSGDSKEIEVELFTWEKLDYVDKIKEKIKT